MTNMHAPRKGNPVAGYDHDVAEYYIQTARRHRAEAVARLIGKGANVLVTAYRGVRRYFEEQARRRQT